MFNDIGNYSLFLCVLVSLYLIYYSFEALQNKAKILSNNLLSTLFRVLLIWLLGSKPLKFQSTQKLCVVLVDQKPLKKYGSTHRQRF